MIRFVVPWEPVAQPRQRHAIRGKGARQFIANYTPANHPVNAFKQACQLTAKTAMCGPLLDGPIRLNVLAVFSRPSSMIWKKREMPRVRKTTKPDFDNVAKALCDALTGIVWKDDAQIASATIEKAIASGNEQPHCVVEIECMSWVWEAAERVL